MRTEPKIWTAGKWQLCCIDQLRETSDVKTFVFKIASSDGIDSHLFFHKPGQFITLRLKHDDEQLVRSYTIASSPSRPRTLCLTIKRDPNGLVSRFMHDHFAIGDLLDIQGPGGAFNAKDIEFRQSVILLSGGSGITPLMSMARYFYDTSNRNHDFVFIHSARTPEDIIYAANLI